MAAFTRLLSVWNPRGPWLVPLLLALTTLYALTPFWLTLHPPMQDLPQHLAAGRVLLDTSHEGFAFDQYFTTEWLRSQYLGIYLLLGAFFHPLRGVTDDALLWATRGAIVVLAATWVVGAEWLFFRLTRKRGFGAFALILFFNVHLILGFLNFLLGTSFALLGLALFSSLRSPAPRWAARNWQAWAFSGVALCCFYFHVVPFALLTSIVLACAVVDGVVSRLRKTPSATLPSVHPTTYAALLPAMFAAGWWLTTPSGVSTREAAAGGGARGNAQYLSFEANHGALGSWTVDAFRSDWDTRWLALSLGLLTVYGLGEWLWVLFSRRRQTSLAGSGGSTPTAPRDASVIGGDPVLLTLLRLAAPACLVAYYVLPASYDWIWPINARFPVLSLLLLPAWFPASEAAAAWRGFLRLAFVALLVLASVGQTSVAKAAFEGFDAEMEGFEELLQHIPVGQRVATLVFERGSRHIGFSPFLHIGAYYQAERGGVAFFSFNDFPQSPVRFIDESRPPRVPPRWEWKPEKVRPDRDLRWFDYLIVRGGPRRLEHAESFVQVYEAGRFRLFEHRP